MANETTVRTLRVQSEERGADQVAAKLTKVAAGAAAASAAVDKYADQAQRGALPITDALTKSQENFAKATISQARSIQSLQRRIDPAFRALSDFEKAQKRVNLAMDQGAITAEHGQKILAGYEARYVKAAQSSSMMQHGLKGVNDNARLTSNQMLNLSRQGNDVITMFALGANPMQIFASQAGQLYDAISAEGGLGAGMKALGNSTKTGLARMVAFGVGLGPLGIGLAAVTAGIAAFVYEFRQDVPDMATTLKDQESILKDIEARYDGIREKIEALPTSSGTGLNIAAGANTRDLGTLIKRESQSVSTDFTSYIGQAIYGAFNFADAPTRKMFEPILQQVDAFRQSLANGNPDVAGFRRQLALMYQQAGDNEPLKKAIEAAYEYTKTLADLEDRLKRNQEALKNIGKAEDEYAAKHKHASDTYLTDTEAQIRQSKLAIRQIQARTVAEKALIAGEQARLKNAGKDITPKLDQLQQAAAEAQIFAEATRAANDALIDTRAAMKTAGLDGYAQSLAEINAEIERQIELNPENAATWRAVGEAKKAALAVETRKSLFQGQEDNLAQLKAEAAAVGAADGRYRDLTTTIQAKIDLERQGIAVTSAAGQAYVENARKLSAYNAEIENQKDAWSDVRNAGSSAIDDLVGGLTDGASSIGDTLKNIADDLLKTFTQLAVSNPLKNALLGTNYGTLADLFSGKARAPSLSFPGLGGLGATPATAMWVRSAVGLGSLLGGGSNDNYPPGAVTRAPLAAINDNLSAAAKAIKAIESGGNYSALGPLTASGDRAYGAYQVMGANVGPWTQKAVGYAMTPNQFMAAPWAQDAVFNRQFGGYASKYGSMQDAASAWFTGRPLSTGANAVDVLGTTGSEYVDKFNAALGRATDATGIAAKGLGDLGSGFNKFGQNLSNWFPPAPGGGGGWSPGNLLDGIGNFFKFGGSGQAFAATFTPGMYATGTDFAPGGLAVIGERGMERVKLPNGTQGLTLGPQLVDLPRGAQVMSNDRLRSMRPANSANQNRPAAYYDNRQYHIDARGAQQGVGEEIKRAIAEYDAQVAPNTARRAVNESYGAGRNLGDL